MGGHINPERRLWILDTSLRDGVQASAMGLRPEDKLSVARWLARLGVDIIEAGFPAASASEYLAVSRISSEVHGVTVAAMARSRSRDIELAAQALASAPRRLLHLSLATSPLHRRYKLRKTPAQLLRMAVSATRLAVATGAQVEFGAEDSTRTEPEFLREFFQAVIEAGAAVVNIADTCGRSLPQDIDHLVRYLHAAIPALGHTVRVSIHCHNDLGLAVANTLAAIQAGCAQAEVSLSGSGDRAGNAALETVVMALKTRSDLFPGIRCSVNPRYIREAVMHWCRQQGICLPPYSAIAGSNAFSHSAGIHVHGMAIDRRMYECVDAAAVSAESDFILTGQSGRAAVVSVIRRLTGQEPAPAVLSRVVKSLRAADDGSRIVGSAELLAVLAASSHPVLPHRWVEFRKVSVSTNNCEGVGFTTVALEFVAQPQGEMLTIRQPAGNASRAVLDGAARLLPAAAVWQFTISQAGDSDRLQSRAWVQLQCAGFRTRGTAVQPDAVHAVALAATEAINQWFCAERNGGNDAAADTNTQRNRRGYPAVDVAAR